MPKLILSVKNQNNSILSSMKIKALKLLGSLMTLFMMSYVTISSGLIASNNGKTGSINLKILGLSNDEGSVAIGLYKEADRFPDYEKSFKNDYVKSSAGGVEYSFENIPEGEYAIAVYQDENENKELDKNFFGMPKEKYGFSNNKFGISGPPKFDEVKFRVTADRIVSLTINIK